MDENNLVGEDFSRSIFDASPAPVFIVDKDLYIHDANKASKTFFGIDLSTGRKRLCGNTLRCTHSVNCSGQCGTTKNCPDCVLRQVAGIVPDGQTAFKRFADMSFDLDGSVKSFSFLVTGAPLEYADKNYAVLTLEDVTELVELRRIVPICSYCRKVRDDSDYWQQVEDYFLKYTNVRFTHGLCPDCMKEHYAEL